MTEQVRAAGRRLLWLEGDGDAEGQLSRISVLACAALPAVAWEHATSLKLVQVMGAGIDHLDLSVLPAGVAIANARGIHTPEIRDHVLAIMLSFARELPRLIVQQAQRDWSPFAAGTIAGKTLGILGLGHIGASVGRACRQLGMRVLATRSHPQRQDDHRQGADEVVGPDATREVMAQADYLLVCLPATASTRNTLNEHMLSALPQHAVVIVVGRGGVVDETALATALHDGRLGGAALDVFAEEPLPEDSPLWTTPRLLISPHLAGWTQDYAQRGMALLLDNLQRLENGEPLLTPVDGGRGY